MDNTNDKIFFNFSYFALKLLGKGLYSNPVSYTHLTLPTICSV